MYISLCSISLYIYESHISYIGINSWYHITILTSIHHTYTYYYICTYDIYTYDILLYMYIYDIYVWCIYYIIIYDVCSEYGTAQVNIISTYIYTYISYCIYTLLYIILIVHMYHHTYTYIISRMWCMYHTHYLSYCRFV